MKRTTCLILLTCAAFTAVADEAPHPPATDQMSATRTRVLELKTQAKTLRHDAEANYKRDSAECRQKVLVNNCLSGAADRRLEKIEQARGIESEYGGLERDIRRYELAERRAERARRLAERKPAPATITVDGGGATPLPQVATPAGKTSPAAPAETAR
jgi:hypothetical protein